MFICISIGSNLGMQLSNFQLCKVSEPMGPTIIVMTLKENKNRLKCTNIKDLKHFMKSCSNSSNKAEKQMIEDKLGKKIK